MVHHQWIMAARRALDAPGRFEVSSVPSRAPHLATLFPLFSAGGFFTFYVLAGVFRVAVRSIICRRRGCPAVVIDQNPTGQKAAESCARRGERSLSLGFGIFQECKRSFFSPPSAGSTSTTVNTTTLTQAGRGGLLQVQSITLRKREDTPSRTKVCQPTVPIQPVGGLATCVASQTDGLCPSSDPSYTNCTRSCTTPNRPSGISHTNPYSPATICSNASTTMLATRSGEYLFRMSALARWPTSAEC